MLTTISQSLAGYTLIRGSLMNLCWRREVIGTWRGWWREEGGRCQEDSDDLVRQRYLISCRIKGCLCGRAILENAMKQCSQQAPGAWCPKFCCGLVCRLNFGRYFPSFLNDRERETEMHFAGKCLGMAAGSHVPDGSLQKFSGVLGEDVPFPDTQSIRNHKHSEKIAPIFLIFFSVCFPAHIFPWADDEVWQAPSRFWFWKGTGIHLEFFWMNQKNYQRKFCTQNYLCCCNPTVQNKPRIQHIYKTHLSFFFPFLKLNHRSNDRAWISQTTKCPAFSCPKQSITQYHLSAILSSHSDFFITLHCHIRKSSVK